MNFARLGYLYKSFLSVLIVMTHAAPAPDVAAAVCQEVVPALVTFPLLTVHIMRGNIGTRPNATKRHQGPNRHQRAKLGFTHPAPAIKHFFCVPCRVLAVKMLLCHSSDWVVSLCIVCLSTSPAQMKLLPLMLEPLLQAWIRGASQRHTWPFLDRMIPIPETKRSQWPHIVIM